MVYLKAGCPTGNPEAPQFLAAAQLYLLNNLGIYIFIAFVKKGWMFFCTDCRD